MSRDSKARRHSRYIGVAPLPYSSGSTDGQVRFTRSGNRQLNTAVHRIAVTQIRMGGPGRSYYDKCCVAGDSSPAAVRKLKRRISRVVFSRLKADEADRHPQSDVNVNVATADTSG